MTDREFLRRLRRYARQRGLPIEYVPASGKGSHAGIWLGGRRTFVPRGELRLGTLRSMLRDLDIDKKDF
ncbi:type II toxin-antitoxin system HicA family toxin [Candidatus Poriferisodalis sp.]|uniref:type II toxin-antitoxin system HicA family toxin n=1 Tax=Candidatus Poriferisodalis sp. TaxID=3101277 RepID=UPI003C7025C5